MFVSILKKQQLIFFRYATYSPTSQISGPDDHQMSSFNLSMSTDNIFGDERKHRQISDSLNLSISQVLLH